MQKCHFSPEGVTKNGLCQVEASGLYVPIESELFRPATTQDVIRREVASLKSLC